MDIQIQAGVSKKHLSELAYWASRYNDDHGVFRNGWYREHLLGIAGEADESFLKGKVVADFGCGPRGSLAWLKNAATKIGIDVLCDLYADAFSNCLITHGMIYLKSTEKVIPLPSEYVDVLFTLNAIDHVENFPLMCAEALRIIKPGGEFIGSFNLNEPASDCEPQTLTEELIEKHLLSHMELISYRRGRRHEGAGGLYHNLFTGNTEFNEGDIGFLWVRYRKP